MNGERSGNIVLMLAGDVMTGRGIDQVLAHACAPGLHESWVRDARDYVRLAEAVNGAIPAPVSPAYIWGDALGEIERVAPDLRIVNLETAVTTSDEAWPAKGIHYRMHPANVDALRAARIDCCVLANNHVLDWERTGLAETLQVLHQAGLHTAGAGVDGNAAWAPAALPLGARGRVLVFACATQGSGVPPGWAAAAGRAGVALLPDLSEATAQQLAARVAQRRDAADRVVLSIHWGENWGLEVPPAHREFAHRLVDLGAADLVHGHSSHHPLPFEVYRGRLILYGCGDLINDYEGIGSRGELRSDVGCLYFVTLAQDRGDLRQLDILPFVLKRFRLGPADATAQAWLAGLFGVGGRVAEALLAARVRGGWSLRLDGDS
jgi:poly-gamma-glutamate capsule biosynthesis protein CapA/YwtB (metallophosphatase superfamily)